MSVPGQSRRFRDAPEESGPPPITDIRCQRLTLIGLDLTVTGFRKALVRKGSLPDGESRRESVGALSIFKFICSQAIDAENLRCAYVAVVYRRELVTID